MTVSVLTLARGRETHLRNLVAGLARQTLLPAELVIGVMQDTLFEGLPPTPFPIHQHLVPGDPVPLAEARNVVAAAATGRDLVFLDVDCIPARGLVADYCEHLAAFEGVLMGEVRYLPQGAATQSATDEALDEVGVKHEDRGGPPKEGAFGMVSDYRCFWSLNFALRAATFARAGGFDAGYVGYGGEDTDFGRTLFARDIPLAWCRGARAYHQYHPHYMPPVHHLASVLRNAERFCAKWGYHTMDHWLRAFTLMGLITRDENGYRILREPGEADFALTYQQAHQPYASTSAILALLESGEWSGRGAPAPAIASA